MQDLLFVKILKFLLDADGDGTWEGVATISAVGEVMGIGRSFQEALQKACQSLEINRNGLGADGKELTNQDQILKSLEFPSWNRLFHIYDAIKLGIPFKKIQQKTRIDDWFLRQIKDLIDLENKLQKFAINSITY